MLLSPTSLRVRHSAVWLTLSFLVATLLVTVLTQKSSEATTLSMPDVLVVHTWGQYPELANWVSDLDADPRLGEVSAFDAGFIPLLASDLAGIEVVFVTTEGGFEDPDDVGAVLADFVDQGGRVIQSTWSFPCTLDDEGPQPWGIGGRWEIEGYAAIVPIAPRGGDCAAYDFEIDQVLQVVDGPSPYLAGVGALNIFQNINLGVHAAPGATLIAKWDVPEDMPAIVVGGNCVMGVTMSVMNFMRVNDYSLEERESVYNLFVNLATLSCVSSSSTTTTSTTTTTAPATATPVTATPTLPETGSNKTPLNLAIVIGLFGLGFILIARVRQEA